MLGEGSQQMTAQRTAIRRRLAVRRSANRPPWGGRKAGHGSIVAPFAATVAATLAATALLGVGVALARERQRRLGEVGGGRRRQFALLPGELLGDGLRRMALEQLDHAIGLLVHDGGETSLSVTVHETRKSLKRLRALIALLEEPLGEATFAREDAILRDAGARLGGARDAEVMVGTLDGVLARGSKKLARRGGVVRLRRALVAERERAAERSPAEQAARLEVLGELRAVRGRVASWNLEHEPGIELLEPGLTNLYRRGRRRLRKAARGKGDVARRMHLWRKRVKDLRYAVELLDRREPRRGALNGRADRYRHKRGRGARGARGELIRRVAREADELAEILGEEHDLAMLAIRIRGGGRGEPRGARPGRKTRRRLLRLIARRRKHLRRRALRRGERLYRRRPRSFVRRLGDAYASTSGGALGDAYASGPPFS